MCVLMDRSVSAILGVIGDVHVSGTMFFHAALVFCSRHVPV